MKKMTVLFILIISVLFLFSIHSFGAQECKTIIISTYPENVDSLPQYECQESELSIVSSSPTIAQGGSITLHVSSDGLTTPPYTWSTTSNGYSFDKSTTDNDLEEVTLSCASGSCGVNFDVTATVTVTDNCGTQFTAKIRNTAGGWSLCDVANVSIGSWCKYGGCYDNCDRVEVDANHRFWVAGSTSTDCMPLPYQINWNSCDSFTYVLTSVGTCTTSCTPQPFTRIKHWVTEIWSCP